MRLYVHTTLQLKKNKRTHKELQRQGIICKSCKRVFMNNTDETQSNDIV